MRCPTCDMAITKEQLRGQFCIHCIKIAMKTPVPKPVAIATPKPAPAPAPAPKPAPAPEPEPEPGMPTTITELRNMKKDQLIEMAESLDIDPEGATKEELITAIADELGI